MSELMNENLISECQVSKSDFLRKQKHLHELIIKCKLLLILLLLLQYLIINFPFNIIHNSRI